MVGRGGRAAGRAAALIQTVDPQHPVLTLAARQDYKSFFAEEIPFRRLNLYPPFCAICMAGFSGANEAGGAARPRALSRRLCSVETQRRSGMPLRLLGPAPMNIAMVNNHYRYKLTLKCRDDNAFRAMLRDALAEYNAAGWPGKVSVYLDFHSDADI